MAAWSFLVFLLLLTGGCHSDSVASSTRSFPPKTGFTQHVISVDGRLQVVHVFVPKSYHPGQRYPAILFLHGLFERGNGEDSRCISGGLGPVIAKNPESWPFITIFPQTDSNWDEDSRKQIAVAALDWAECEWSIDPDRVILAGLSLGGRGTWEIGAQYSTRFAALVPVSGPCATSFVAKLIVLPVWAFAYQTDPFVSAHNSELMCKSIRQLGGQARLTEFLGIGHDCWDKAVAESDLVPWMLQQRRKVVAPVKSPTFASPGLLASNKVLLP